MTWNEDLFVEALDDLGDTGDDDDAAKALKELARSLPQYLWFYHSGSDLKNLTRQDLRNRILKLAGTLTVALASDDSYLSD